MQLLVRSDANAGIEPLLLRERHTVRRLPGMSPTNPRPLGPRWGSPARRGPLIRVQSASSAINQSRGSSLT
jgi:hypothetical protein